MSVANPDAPLTPDAPYDSKPSGLSPSRKRVSLAPAAPDDADAAGSRTLFRSLIIENVSFQ